MKPTLLSNAIVHDPSQGIINPFDVLIVNGKVAKVAQTIRQTDEMTVVDLSGYHLSPGFIDLHCHLREPGDEGAESIATGTRAAAAGGYTTIYAMANTNPICDTITGVQYVISRAAKTGCGVRVVPIAAVTRGQLGEEITNYGLLKSAGAGAFSDDYKPIMNAEVLRCALNYTRMLGIPIMDHCQDLNLTGEGVMHQGIVSLQLGLKGIPRVAESIMVARDVALAEATGGHIHISHISTRESVEIIREAKRNGVRVTTEVTPHHLLMTDEDVRGYNTMAKVMPPLCAEKDRRALIEGLRDGTIDCIVTDHAPHSNMAKASVFEAASFGVIGFESAFRILHQKLVVEANWSVDSLLAKLTSGPAKVMGLPRGSLRVGADADFTLFKLDDSGKIDPETFESKSRNCPWAGEKVSSSIALTAVAGRVVWSSNPELPQRLGLPLQPVPTAIDVPIGADLDFQVSHED
ncbi:MAG: dihydroorotase [Candidatus Sumerlaeia bacterium]|nr:dihydroorotase [Candidatus Sumerlaeia bacterium]